jgi:serine protease Do
MKGELVGINSIKYSGVGVEGMSFSIPVDTVNYVLTSFEKYGKVLRPDMGITLTESWEAKIGVPTKKGLTVSVSKTESILPGDVITHVNGYEVHSIADYNEAVKKSFNGQSITLNYTRLGIAGVAEITTN